MYFESCRHQRSRPLHVMCKNFVLIQGGGDMLCAERYGKISVRAGVGAQRS